MNLDLISHVRQELPSRILDLKAELECLKQGLAEEKVQFLQTLEDEKAKLAEEEENLNIKLAARNMAKERNRARAFQDEVVLIDDQVEDSPVNGGGEDVGEENLLRDQEEDKGGDGDEVEGQLVDLENVEESEEVVDEVEKP